MNKTIPLMLLGSFIGSAHATLTSVPEQVAQCQKVIGDAARLGCFDRIVKQGADDKEKTTTSDEIKEPQSTGKWVSSNEISPIDDSRNEYISLAADNQIYGRFGESPTPGLWISCKEKKTELLINWDIFLSTQNTQVLTRLDSKKAITRTWTMSTNSKATYYSGSTISFIKELMQSQKLYAQTTPYGENTVKATFDLSGLSNAIKPLREACKW